MPFFQMRSPKGGINQLGTYPPAPPPSAAAGSVFRGRVMGAGRVFGGSTLIAQPQEPSPAYRLPVSQDVPETVTHA